VECVRAFRAHFDFVHRALRRYGAQAADLDDLIQEVFVALWLRWEQFDRRRPLKPWLAGIAFRLARNHARRRRHEVREEPLEIEDPLQQGEETVVAAQNRALVLTALGRLPEKYRLPLVMHEVDEMTIPEVAEILALPLATVYTQLRRGRLAFAAVVRALSRAPLSPEALLAGERTPPEAPASGRKRGESRLRALLAAPSLRSDPLARRPPRLAHHLGLLIGVATLALVAVRAGRSGASDRPPRAAPPSAAVGSPLRPSAARRPLPQLVTTRPTPLRPPVTLTLDVGLVGSWPLDDGPGSGLVHDVSGQGRHCRMHDIAPPAAWIRGVRGGALDLAGRGWLECPLPETPAGSPVELTVAAWVRRSSTATPAALATRQIGTGFHDQFFFGFGGDGLRVVSHAWSGWAVEPAPPPSGRWFHAAFTHAAGTTRLYVDGAEVAESRGRPLEATGVDTPVTIGAGRFSAHRQQVRQHFGGALDELRIYDRALTATEIAALADL
jgi:RNA polymerase sigma factor (sigma-70 family)